jgi:hypothetical protein
LLIPFPLFSSIKCLKDLVFPLLSDLLDEEKVLLLLLNFFINATFLLSNFFSLVLQERASEGMAGATLGKDRGTGKSVMMMVHYRCALFHGYSK